MADKDENEADDKASSTPNPTESADEDRPEGEAETDEAAARVATALGVGAEQEAEAAEAKEAKEEPKAAPNRAARRREEAVKRRRKAAAASASDDELPKDRNARAKELLSRRQEQAAERRPVALAPSEMVEDALSRMTSNTSKWLRKNFTVVQWGIVAAIVVVGGVLFYLSRVDKTAGEASGTLAAAVAADRGRVMAEDKRSDDEKEYDTVKVFKTPEERADTALASYKKVMDEHGGSGAAILARLGQAGVLLDKKDWAGALDAYGAVLATPLAAADADVRGRAIEGIGFAKEGKADLDGALASFKELEGVEGKGYKELALYHQARIHLAKGDKDKAKELLKTAREKLQTPSTDGQPFQFLTQVVDTTLRGIDPSLVPAKTQLGGPKGSTMTPEEIERLFREAQERAKQKAPPGEERGEHE